MALPPRPSCIVVPGVLVRHVSGPEARSSLREDISCWCELRSVAWDVQTGEGRLWTEQDVIREFVAKPWWDSRRLLLAFAEERPGVAIGSVSSHPGRLPGESVLNWLMVRPGYRRRGVAGMLLSHLERDCQARGERTLVLETMSTWHSAIAFYEAMGFVRA